VPPQYLQFFPSFLCNLQCDFCFNRGVEVQQAMSLTAVRRLAAVAASEGIGEIDILGGEPTLYSSLEGMVESFAGRGLCMSLSSNGADPGRLAGLSTAYPPEILRIGVSITADGITDSLDEYILRFGPLLKAICTRDRGVRPSVKRYLNLPGITYSHLFMDTLRPEDLGMAMPYFAYREILEELRADHPDIEGVACAGFVPDSSSERQLAGVRCPAGTTKLSVMPDGSVYPCYLFFRNPQFRLGSILDDDFALIWKHPVLGFFRHFEGNLCRRTGCTFVETCRGGCPALGLLFSGDLRGPDPRCALPW
jgi:radical SAM protein with 4Fe4S-binding SPASM domain